MQRLAPVEAVGVYYEKVASEALQLVVLGQLSQPQLLESFDRQLSYGAAFYDSDVFGDLQ